MGARLSSLTTLVVSRLGSRGPDIKLALFNAKNRPSRSSDGFLKANMRRFYSAGVTAASLGRLCDMRARLVSR